MWDTPLQLTTPETDSGLTGEPSPTDYVWNVKLACRKDTALLFVLGDMSIFHAVLLAVDRV